MSLLMEALRKAEEAKRQAAQKDKFTTDPAIGDVEMVSAAEAEDAVAMQAEEAPLSSADVPETTLGISFRAEEPAASPGLDVPFDFQIDESFGSLDLKPVSADQATENSRSAVAQAVGNAEHESLLDLDPEIDYVKPETLRQLHDKVAMESAAVEERPKAAALTLTLEDAPDRDEPPRATFIADPDPASGEGNAKVEAVMTLASEPPAASPAIEPPGKSGAEEPPLRASRVEESEAARTETAPARPRFKVPGSKGKEEDRKRESARAVFNAKAGQATGFRNKRRLVAVAAVLALIPLAGGGYLLVQEMGLLGGGNQYNIPAANYDAAGNFTAIPEQIPVSLEAVQLADVTQDPIVDTASVVDTVSAEIAAPVDTVIDSGVVQSADAVAVSADAEVAAPVQTVGPVEQPESVDDADVLSESPIQEVVVATTEAEVIANDPVTPEVAIPTATATPAPINIIRNDNAPAVNAQLASAYAAFQDQDYFAARSLYQQALRELPNNRDALLGLAAVSVQLGDVSTARELYSRLLQLDPRDVLARVGLLDSMPLGDSVQTETQLLSLKSEHPEIAQLAFALGNFYAGQRRWNEAQAAYYDALLAAKAQSGSAVSPDFAFNLAVSLDRLNQPEPAYNFYREALEQSRTVNPGFDLRILRDRLDSLERQLP